MLPEYKMTNSVHYNSEYLCELLPWYVNETLNDKELRAMDRHLGHCAACSQEVAILRAVRESARRESVSVLVPKPDVEQFLATAKRQKNRTVLHRTAWVAGALAASVALIVALLSWTQSDLVDTGPAVYVTATDAGSGASFDYVLLISFVQGIEPDMHDTVLQALAPVSVAGPDSAGNYRVVIRLPAQSLDEIESYRQSVESDAAVSSAAVVAIELPIESR
jgi:hypothetical protein